MADEQKYLSVEALAKRWDRDPEWVRRSANAKRIPAVKIGDRWRFDLADIEAYENRRRNVGIDPLSMTDRAKARRSA